MGDVDFMRWSKRTWLSGQKEDQVTQGWERSLHVGGAMSSDCRRLWESGWETCRGARHPKPVALHVL